ncbi:MAG: DUF1887 family CARF protein [Syntrophorhabdaceae bacterium]|nr:DUF1887 family CARF protein [Syntrophorhabdaceae bacterium]
MKRIHVCLVSAQPIPNLIPLRMEGLKPEKVILFVSLDMKIQADRLEGVIKGWGIAVEKVPISPYDLEAARKTVKEILSSYNNYEIILNATGGTKIMAFAAFEVFREHGKKIIYVDTQDSRIQTLSPSSEYFDFQGVLKVPSYLNAYGQFILKEKTDKNTIKMHTPILNELIDIWESTHDAIKTLNSRVAPFRNARTFPLEIKVDARDDENENFRSIIEFFKRHGMLNYRNGRIRLPDLASVEFVTGGWLEEYVFSIVDSLPVTDVRMGVEVKWDVVPSRQTMNEYDVVFTHNNRLFLIECKTKRFEGTDRLTSNDEPIYKLDSLRDAAGGIYGKGMLVSYQRLTDAQKTRLSANKLAFCDSTDLKYLKNKIAQWIGL